MFDREARAAIAAAAVAEGLEPAILLAVAEVESGGVASARINGRDEPLIRYEGHYFDRLLPPSKRAAARAAGLASPNAGGVANPASQAARWALLDRATQIDRAAALQSVSWGLGQVMGAHWQWLGFADVEALVTEARAGVAGQVRLMLRFIRAAGLLPVLRAHDWAGFARRYNGPAYARHGYHTKLAAAHRRWSDVERQEPSAPTVGVSAGHLRTGSRGPAVRDLQRRLSALGHPVAVDGDFGPATDRALRMFQREARLSPDGIAGPRTLAALDRGLPPAPPRQSLLAAVMVLLRTLWAKGRVRMR